VAFLLELVPALLAGLLLARRWPDLAARLAPLMVRYGVPFSVMGLLLRAGVDWRFANVLALALGLVAAGLLLVGRWLRAPVEQLGAVVGNTAYFGIPAAVALLPADVIGYSVSYDLAATLLTWSLGPVLIGAQGLRPRLLLASLVSSPAIRGLAAALLVQLTPWRAPLAALVWWPARVIVVLSLVMVGLRMAPALTVPLPPRLWPAVVVKLLLFPLLALGVLQLLHLPPPARAAVVLQAATPTAVSVLLLAEAVQPAAAGDTDLVPATDGAAVDAASLVLWSTLLALLTVPLWARLLGG
jgi:predicted permease